MKGYGVNAHETKSLQIHGKIKQWNNAFIVVLHLEVTMRPSTMSFNAHSEINNKRNNTQISVKFVKDLSIVLRTIGL